MFKLAQVTFPALVLEKVSADAISLQPEELFHLVLVTDVNLGPTFYLMDIT